MPVMPSVDDVVSAYHAIGEAWETYRATLRACIEEGGAEGRTGRQAEISRRIGRTRETLRQDAMTPEQREQLRRAEADRRKKSGLTSRTSKKPARKAAR